MSQCSNNVENNHQNPSITTCCAPMSKCSSPDRDTQSLNIAENLPFPATSSNQLALIAADSTHTLFEKRVWATTCQIPPGFVTTYGLIAAHLRTSPRAVGNALRKNPYAPLVPCHRVVASGGNLGGFKGRISTKAGKSTTYTHTHTTTCTRRRKKDEGVDVAKDTVDKLKEKIALLKREGVKFGSDGKVRGSPFNSFS